MKADIPQGKYLQGSILKHCLSFSMAPFLLHAYLAAIAISTAKANPILQLRQNLPDLSFIHVGTSTYYAYTTGSGD
jgi:hypothetical protein